MPPSSLTSSKICSGEVFLVALEDADTVEIVLNADGLMWQERLGEPLRQIGSIIRRSFGNLSVSSWTRPYTAELQCAAKDYVQYHTSPERSMTQLVRMSMRMRPDRILVGEVRGPEALDLLMSRPRGA